MKPNVNTAMVFRFVVQGYYAGKWSDWNSFAERETARMYIVGQKRKHPTMAWRVVDRNNERES